jgi:glutamyl-tRNA synthetase
MTVVTRFAPSPTGSLHIGGARTALFNYLWAKHNGGKFLLRIEDTDAQRNQTHVESQIVEALKWLGLDWDDAIFKQSENAYQQVSVATSLVDSGAAYMDWTTEAEMETMRAAHTGKGPFRYDSPYRDQTFDTESPEFWDGVGAEPHVIRMKAPREGQTTIDDHVQGPVTIQNSELDDFIILRSDGSPTFLLAGVVDDIEMGVNWVIRGDDHLNNAFRQKLIYDALGEPVPNYAHVPLIHNAGGQKYSKRDGAAGVEEFAVDFLPDALFNYLLRLGWGHGDDEIISREQAIEWFDIAKVGRGPSRFDMAKLKSINTHYLRSLSPPEMTSMLGVDSKYEWLMPEVQKRVHTLPEAVPYLRFIHLRPEPLFDQISLDLIPYVEGRDWTDAKDLKEAVDGYCEAQGIKLREVAQALRWSLAGQPHSLSVFDIMVALGKDETIIRLMGNQVPAR